ncbi:MAG: metal-dependent hydrolase [Nanoarchaeota archaeon]|nr:metal-dependent hydrolase [Nanoarchaeota archaeon]
MMSYTHALSGVLVFSLMSYTPVLILVGAVACLLPDIDTTHSFIGKLFKPISKRINNKYGHRTVMHSFLALTGVFLIGILVSTQLAIVLTVGYFLHLFFDMLNPTGVPLLYPSCLSFVIFSGIIPTRSRRETWLFVILFLILTIHLLIVFFNIDLLASFKSLVYAGG